MFMKTIKAIIITDDRGLVIRRKLLKHSTFTHGGHRYVASSDKIFLKPTLFGNTGISIYHEGNPQPYDLKNTNAGINSSVLNELYSPALFRILVKAEKNPVDLLLFILIALNIILTIVAIAMAAT